MSNLERFFCFFGAAHLLVDVALVVFILWFVRSSKREAQRLDEDN